jgi:hypothetical protein
VRDGIRMGHFYVPYPCAPQASSVTGLSPTCRPHRRTAYGAVGQAGRIQTKAQPISMHPSSNPPLAYTLVPPSDIEMGRFQRRLSPLTQLAQQGGLGPIGIGRLDKAGHGPVVRPRPSSAANHREPTCPSCGQWMGRGGEDGRARGGPSMLRLHAGVHRKEAGGIW